MILRDNRPLELLVVEDNPGDVLLLKEYLELSKVPVKNIFQAGSIDQVSEILQGHEVDLAFLDLSLPDSDGIYSFILLHRRLPDTPIIVLTGLSDISVALEALSLGAQDYVMKNDFNEKLLSRSIQYSIERKKAEQKSTREKKLSDAIINSLPGIFYFYNAKGELLRWNKNFETVSGYSSEELSTLKPDQFFENQYREATIKRIEKLFTKGYANAEGILLTKSGEKIPYYFTGFAIEFEGKPCMIGMGIDITDRKNAEREMNDLNEQLRNFSMHLQTVREEEQARIAREIHDELGQQITGLKMDIGWLKKKLTSNFDHFTVQEKLNTMNALLDDTVVTIRKIASQLRPSILDDLGLSAALEWQSKEFEKRFNIKISYRSELKELEVLPSIATGIFRIYQESLTNIARHSEAKSVFTRLDLIDNKIVLDVSDNGKGFVITQGKLKKTLGLLGMKERALMIGGDLEIKSEPGKGTTITVKVPYADNPKQA
jgi:PAS domain S-box-containing protein